MNFLILRELYFLLSRKNFTNFNNYSIITFSVCRKLSPKIQPFSSLATESKLLVKFYILQPIINNYTYNTPLSSYITFNNIMNFISFILVILIF